MTYELFAFYIVCEIFTNVKVNEMKRPCTQTSCETATFHFHTELNDAVFRQQLHTYCKDKNTHILI